MKYARKTTRDIIRLNLSALIDEHGPTANYIADTCGVSRSTARRWINGDTCPRFAEYELLRLNLQQRTIPDNWPKVFRFQDNGYLDTGGPDCLSWQQLQYTRWLIGQHYKLLNLVPVLEGEIDELKRLLPKADIILLDTYRARLLELASAQFDEPAAAELAEKSTTRLFGC